MTALVASILLPAVLVVPSWGDDAVTQEKGAQEKADKGLAIGAAGPAISLGDYRGKKWDWDVLRGQKLTVVAFLGTECPLVKLYSGRLEAMSKTYGAKGVAFIGVNTNQHDSLSEIAHFVLTNKVSFPLLKDSGNRIADAYRAKRTPEVFVLDQANRIQYRGRIDDQYTYGLQKPKVTREHLKSALDQLLAGKRVTVAKTETVGCHIGRLLKPDSSSKVTYSNQISRILQRRCVTCHQPGEIAPFALTDYQEVVGWAQMIAEVVDEQRMPPWHANPKHGDFSNDASLSEKEKELIADWVDAGAPQGDPSKLPKPIEFTKGWRIGKPDLIVKMSEKPFHVPAEGEVRYQYFVVDPGFKEDKWVKAAECRPGNRSVVHHIIVASRPARGGRRASHAGLSSEWIAATAPGAAPLILADGLAKRIPAGSQLLFQMHYTPNGEAQDDLSSVGFVFADPKTVKKEVVTKQAANGRFRIPAGADNHPVKAQRSFERDTIMLTMFPHMHLRGKSFRYTLVYPDEREEILLDVPHYDFNWQNQYRFAEPKFIPAGSRLVCTAHFDNSEANLANPNPNKSVIWGDQTWEEMMIGYFDMCLADQDLTRTVKTKSRTEKVLAALKGEPFESGRFGQQLAEGLRSQDELKKFGRHLHAEMGQIDRLDWSFVDGDKLRIERVVQSIGPATASKPLSVSAAGLALAEYAEKQRVVVNQALDSIRNPDFRLMNRHFQSSLHVPTKRDGKEGLISFWSSEKDAFPPAVVKALTDMVESM